VKCEPANRHSNLEISSPDYCRAYRMKLIIRTALTESLWVTLTQLLASSWLMTFGGVGNSTDALRVIPHHSQTQCAAKDERTSRLNEDGQKSATPLTR